jgi:hypothetical protein
MKTRRSLQRTVAFATLTVLMAVTAAAAVGVPRRARAVANCSRKNLSGVAPSRWPAARHQLAPPGPGAIRLCRYSGLNDHPPMTLVSSALVGSAQVRHRLVGRLDALPRPPAIAACPSDDGTAIVAHLAYPTGRAVTIRVGLNGCRSVTNGDVWRTAAGSVGDRLIAQLERLSGPPRP